MTDHDQLSDHPSMTSRTGGSWGISKHARELKFGTQVKNHISWCQEWPHPPSIQSGTFSVLQVWLRGWGVLDTLLFMLESWHLAHKSRITYHDDPWCQEWPHPPSIQSGTFNVLQVWIEDMGSWHTSIHAREFKFGTQVKNNKSWRSMISRMTPTSKYPVRNHQRPPCMNFEDRGFLTLF